MTVSRLDSISMIYGLKKVNTENAYYHPLRRKLSKSKVVFEKSWADDMTEQILVGR
jgi:hypothetical protein